MRGRAVEAAQAAIASVRKPNLVAIKIFFRFGCKHFGDEFLVSAVGIDVGGIPEIDADLDGFFEGGDGFCVVGLAIAVVHAHAAEADGR
jgi:hypothetical protein